MQGADKEHGKAGSRRTEPDATQEAEGGIRLVVCDDHEALSRRAADFIVQQVRRRPSLLLCAASGSTPTRTYALLAQAGQAAPHLFDHVRVLQLDEWVGLPAEDPGRCERYLRSRLLDPLGIPDDRFVRFHSDAAGPEAACRRMAAELDAQGPIDLCVLGLGLNGHLAFNEPADELVARPHVAVLDEQTMQHPMLDGAGAQPRRGLTLGMADLLQARKILLLVGGAPKRDILGRLLSSGITTRLPATLLRLHADCTLMCDRAAAGR